MDLFFSSARTGVLKKVLRMVCSFYISRGASRTSMGNVRRRTEHHDLVRMEVEGVKQFGGLGFSAFGVQRDVAVMSTLITIDGTVHQVQ